MPWPMDGGRPRTPALRHATSVSAILTARCHAMYLWLGKTPNGRRIGDAYAMLDVLWVFLTAVQAAMRPRQDLVLENLLLHHQVAVLTRPTRRRSPARFRYWPTTNRKPSFSV